MGRDARTLATSPAQPNPTTPNWESLHLLDGTLGIGFSYELHETAVLPNRYFNLYILNLVYPSMMRQKEKRT